MTLNAPFKVHTYYIYLLKLSIIPHKLFWPYVIFFLNSKDCFLLYIHNFNTPPPKHTPIVASCFEEKVANVKKFTDGRTDGQIEKDLWTDSRTYARTDRQTKVI